MENIGGSKDHNVQMEYVDLLNRIGKDFGVCQFMDCELPYYARVRLYGYMWNMPVESCPMVCIAHSIECRAFTTHISIINWNKK